MREFALAPGMLVVEQQTKGRGKGTVGKSEVGVACVSRHGWTRGTATEEWVVAQDEGRCGCWWDKKCKKR